MFFLLTCFFFDVSFFSFFPHVFSRNCMFSPPVRFPVLIFGTKARQANYFCRHLRGLLRKGVFRTRNTLKIRGGFKWCDRLWQNIRLTKIQRIWPRPKLYKKKTFWKTLASADFANSHFFHFWGFLLPGGLRIRNTKEIGVSDDMSAS